MIRAVVALPDPVLSRPAVEIDEIDDDARQLGRDLVDTMRSAGHSVGIAAPQIGVGLRAFALDVTGHRKANACHGLVVLFNPRVVEREGREVGREGCMSVPDLTGDVARATHLVVEGLDPEGELRRIETDAFEARAFQHELDHLDGHVFLDRLVAADRVFARRVYK